MIVTGCGRDLQTSCCPLQFSVLKVHYFVVCSMHGTDELVRILLFTVNVSAKQSCSKHRLWPWLYAVHGWTLSADIKLMSWPLFDILVDHVTWAFLAGLWWDVIVLTQKIMQSAGLSSSTHLVTDTCFRGVSRAVLIKFWVGFLCLHQQTALYLPLYIYMCTQ